MRRKRQRNPGVVIGIALLFAIGVIVWYGMTRIGWHLPDFHATTGPATATPAPGKPTDATNEGRRMTVSGMLSAPSAVRDANLGISADAIILFRNVEMYQWQEECKGGDCRYAQVWSAKPIDSSRFHTPAGHENPAFPFATARFSTGPVKLDGYTVDPDMIISQLAPQKRPVRASELPANLAATFRESDGDLTTADDPNHPKPGALRVGFRIIPAGESTLTGVQHGQHLSAN